MRTLKGVTGGIDGPERPEDAAFYRRVLRASAEDAVWVVRALVPVHGVLGRHLIRCPLFTGSLIRNSPPPLGTA